MMRRKQQVTFGNYSRQRLIAGLARDGFRALAGARMGVYSPSAERYAKCLTNLRTMPFPVIGLRVQSMIDVYSRYLRKRPLIPQSGRSVQQGVGINATAKSHPIARRAGKALQHLRELLPRKPCIHPLLGVLTIAHQPLITGLDQPFQIILCKFREGFL